MGGVALSHRHPREIGVSARRQALFGVSRSTAHAIAPQEDRTAQVECTPAGGRLDGLAPVLVRTYLEPPSSDSDPSPGEPSPLPFVSRNIGEDMRIVAGIIVAATFAVCSGDAADAVTSAAEATVAKATFRFELTGEWLDLSLPDPTLIEATGHVAMGAPRRADLSASHMAIEIPGAGPTDIVVNGDDVYIRGGVFTDIPGCSPHQWVQTDPSRAEADKGDGWILAGAIYDVRLFIYYLFGISGTPRELGEESIDGLLARHYSTTLDLQKANDMAPTDIRTMLTADLAEMREAGVPTEVPADIWIDGSGLLRQTVFLFSFDDGTRVRVTTAYSEFGSPLRDIPDPAEVCQR
jgi:hypothetical protein